MKTFEVRNGTDEEATMIGLVVAANEIEAISTLQAYRNGFGVTKAAPPDRPPHPYVEWAHEKLKSIPSVNISVWTARPVD